MSALQGLGESMMEAMGDLTEEELASGLLGKQVDLAIFFE